jgi:hypothetical protein
VPWQPPPALPPKLAMSPPDVAATIRTTLYISEVLPLPTRANNSRSRFPVRN